MNFTSIKETGQRQADLNTDFVLFISKKSVPRNWFRSWGKVKPNKRQIKKLQRKTKFSYHRNGNFSVQYSSMEALQRPTTKDRINHVK